ncbi:MAG: hypothetical protein LH609_11620 [Rudanella sp.]|nr:hypothetical protein [Rudanella sp.]
MKTPLHLLTGKPLIAALERQVQESGELMLVGSPDTDERKQQIIDLAQRAGLGEFLASALSLADKKDIAISFLFYELSNGYWVFETVTGIVINNVALLPLPVDAYEINTEPATA